MPKSASEIRAEFDRIAAARVPGDDESQPYDPMLASLVPANCGRLLELGCGTGRLTNVIAPRVEDVTAVDFSAEMLRVARERCAAHRNVQIVEGDVLSLPNALGPFDCVISVNLLHHLPVEQAARTMKTLLAPGGLLIIHDLRQTAGGLDRLMDAPRLAVKLARLLSSPSRVRSHLRHRAAWAQHADGEIFLTAREIIEMRNRHFPGAAIHQHFLWRYTLLWTRHE